MKKTFIIFSFLILLFLFSCKMNFLRSKLTKIIITDFDTELILNERHEINDFLKYFKSMTPLAYKPSCPFGKLAIIFYTDEKKYVLFYATDTCPTIRFNNSYYKISDRSNESLRKFIRKYGIKDQHLVK